MPDKKVTEGVKKVLEQGETAPAADAGTAPPADTAATPAAAPTAAVEQPAQAPTVNIPGHGDEDVAFALKTAQEWSEVAKGDLEAGKFMVAAQTFDALSELMKNLEKAQPYDY